jgi:stage V sporulation protein R
MPEFALKTALPAYLRKEQERIEEHARTAGLDFFPIVYEMLSYDQMNEVAAFSGFPARYPHWRFGMEYEQLSKSYEYGASKIYEMVINNNPSFAYLLEGNSLVDQKMVMCHVCGHVDFFKNNFVFRATDLDARGQVVEPTRLGANYDPNRKWIDKMANHGARVSRHIARHGIDKVEPFIDACLSLENLVDPYDPFKARAPARAEEEDEDREPQEVPRLRAKSYMDSFINPDEYIEAQKKKLEAERDKPRKHPERPERDVLRFLLENAPLERWERDVLEIIREEAYYFIPQMQTKIMNEGWACIAPESLVFSERGLLPMREIVEARVGAISDGEAPRTIYGRNVIRDHATVTIRTRRGLVLRGSDNHRVLRADGETWARLDALAIGDRVAVRGGAGLWAEREVELSFAEPSRVTLHEVAAAAGTSVWTVMRHRAGQPTRTAARIDAALSAYDAGARTLPRSRKSVRIPSRVDEVLGAFLGYLIGDGHVSRAKREIGFTTADTEAIATFADLALQLFGVYPSIRWDDGRYRVIFHSETVSDFLIDTIGLTFGPSAPRKTIPDCVLRSPEPVVRAFLRAYFDCDAYAGKQGVILSTASETMSEQVQLLLLNFGVLSRRRAQQDGCWHVHVAGRSAETFALKVGFGLSRKKEQLERHLMERRWTKAERWDDEVVAIEHGRGDVYDISVEETHRYAAQGFVNHNSYWHSKLMTGPIGEPDEILDYADRNAGVMATSGGRLNPYKLGVELYRDVEERWNRGMFGKDWEECDDVQAKNHWDLRLGLGFKKILQVRALYNDVTFLDEFLTPEFARRHKLFSFGYNQRNERYEIESREFKQVKDKLLFQLTNFGNPFIYVEDANFENRGELLLRHDHQGIDLRVDYAREVMAALVRVWKRPVCVLTKAEDKAVMLRYDGKEHTSKQVR